MLVKLLIAISICFMATGCDPMCNRISEGGSGAHLYGEWEITTNMQWVNHPDTPVCLRICKHCGHRQYK
jgi:hypothetical protein